LLLSIELRHWMMDLLAGGSDMPPDSCAGELI